MYFQLRLLSETLPTLFDVLKNCSKLFILRGFTFVRCKCIVIRRILLKIWFLIRKFKTGTYCIGNSTWLLQLGIAFPWKSLLTLKLQSYTHAYQNSSLFSTALVNSCSKFFSSMSSNAKICLIFNFTKI